MAATELPNPTASSAEALFRAYVDHVTDAFFLLDEQLQVVDVNRTACENLAFSREELIGMHPRDFTAELDDATIAKFLQDAARRETVDIDARLRRKDQSVFPVEIRARTVRLAGKLFYLALARDITERQLAEERRSKLAAIVESSDDAIIGKDLKGIITNWNAGAERMFGYAAADAIGQSITILMPPDRVDEMRVILEQIRRGERVNHIETVRRRKDGTLVDISLTVSPIIDGSGNVVGASKVARDITERKLAEERKSNLAAIVESSDDAIIGKDLSGTITTWNAGSERMFGYAARDVIGKPVAILMPADRAEEMRGILERVRGGERVNHFETVRRRKDGTLVDISLTVSPIVDGSGKVVGASKIARDITERKRAEQALQEKEVALETARTELARVSRLTALGELTTSIAHEVAQPLGGMIASAGACARWLSAEPPDIAEARAAIDNIAADGKRAREVIARIRALTKRQLPNKEMLDINQEALGVLALTAWALRGSGIVVRTPLDKTLPRVMGDRVQLQQVLINLIMNAIDAMSGLHDRPRELTIVSGRAGPKAARLEVRDSGTGLNPKGAEQVFEAFYTTKAEGIGIGLSISRSIIEAHGGRLWASPNEPYGAVFQFTLPVSEEALS